MADGDENDRKSEVLKAIGNFDQLIGGVQSAKGLRELPQMLHPSFTLVGPDGDLMQQASVIDNLRSQNLVFNGGPFRRKIKDVVLPTETMAITRSDLSFQGRILKRAESGDLRDTITLVKTKGWRLFAWHLTRLPPIRPRKGRALEKREILRFFKDYQRATMQKNRLAVATMVHENYRIVNPDASDLPGAVMAAESEQIDFSQFARDDFNVKIEGDTAVATTVFSIVAKLGDRNFTGRFRDSNTFVRSRNSWKVVATQISKMPDL